MTRSEIGFAYQSFKWTNSARDKAGVTCVIVGLRNKQNKDKYIYFDDKMHRVNNINPYLSDGPTRFLENRETPISCLPKISSGNYTGHAVSLSLSDEEKKELLINYPEAKNLVKILLGSQEFINSETRWCLWINNNQRLFAESIPPIKKRIKQVKDARLSSKDKSANQIANRPHQFRDTKETTTTSVIIPTVSSELRKYIPIGFIDKAIIVSNRNHIVYDTEPFVFGVVSSRMHNVWIKSVAGRLETRINYSSDMCYNNFPIPPISEAHKKEIERRVYLILEEREAHSEKTLAQLYDPDKMPDGLREAHHQNDLAVERCYRSKPFESDEERLEYLFKLYEQMIVEEEAMGTLFEVEVKTKKRKK